MALPRSEFILPAHITIAELKTKLYAIANWQTEPTISFTRTYFDSHDWRLFHADSVLSIECHDNHSFELSWQVGKSYAAIHHLQLTQLPRFAWDLPNSPIQAKLEKILDLRALLPMVSMDVTCHPLLLLNQDQKTVLRVFLEENRMSSRPQTTSFIENRLYVVAVKGYQKPIKKITKFITKELSLSAASNSLLISSLGAIQTRHPGDYTSKPHLEIDAQMSANIAVKRILQHLFTMQRANEEGLKADLDTEFLHDFRVAIRRTRSVLSQLKIILPNALLDKFKPEFAWLSQITSTKRDLDVYLLKFANYSAELSHEDRQHLAPLFEFLQRQQQTELRRLVKRLDSKRYQTFLSDWNTALTTDWPADQSTISIKAVADKRIWKTYRKLLVRGQIITDDTPAEALHDLRKLGKKLRYLLEFFQSLYAQKKIRRLIKSLKKLQDNLGEFQDFEVQASTLRQYSQQLTDKNKLSADSLIAVGILIADLERRQQQARDEFAQTFAEFSRKKNAMQFKALFKTQQPDTTLAHLSDV